MTTTPVVLHILRPYASVDEYIAAEAWTVDARNMLLIGEPELPTDTQIVFDVTLSDGSRPIKAEGRVNGMAEPSDGRPGGLKVRFKRYGAPTKAFIDRAVALVASGAGAPGAAEPSSPEPSVVSMAEGSAPEAAEAPSPTAAVADAAQPEAPGGFAQVPVAQSGSPNVPGGLRALRERGDQMPETPSNREYLLEKLRQRGQGDDVTMRYQGGA